MFGFSQNAAKNCGYTPNISRILFSWPAYTSSAYVHVTDKVLAMIDGGTKVVVMYVQGTYKESSASFIFEY